MAPPKKDDKKAPASKEMAKDEKPADKKTGKK